MKITKIQKCQLKQSHYDLILQNKLITIVQNLQKQTHVTVLHAECIVEFKK